MKKFDISNLIITQICDAYSYTLEEETVTKAVCEHCVLILKHCGATQYTVGNKAFTANAEQILFLPANCEYEMQIEKEGECTVIEFDVIGEEALYPCEFYSDSEGDIAASSKNLLLYWKLQGPAYHSKCLSELYDLITQLSNIMSSADSLVGKYPLIHRSVKYIEKNYHKIDLYTPALAKMSGIGETYYRSIFLAVFHMPPARYIQKIRIDKAKELLVSSGGSIEDIAVSTGFANASYFCKVFKSVVGITPTEFAQKSRRFG